MTDVVVLLSERAKTHGAYNVVSRIAQRLENRVNLEPGYQHLTDGQKEAIHMIFCKIGRIVAGDNNYKDHWDDIAGYAKLISNEIENR